MKFLCKVGIHKFHWEYVYRGIYFDRDSYLYTQVCSRCGLGKDA